MNEEKFTIADRILYKIVDEKELREYAESLDNELLNRDLLCKKEDIFAAYALSAKNSNEKLSGLPTDSISPYVALLGSDGNLPELPTTPKSLVRPSLKEIVEKSPIAETVKTKQFEYLLQGKTLADIIHQQSAEK